MRGRHPVTVVTGASSGIGRELARVFARHGHRLVLVARRSERLNTLADEIANRGHARPLSVAVDLGQQDAGSRIDAALAENGLEPQFVINNAGFGLAGFAAGRPRDLQLTMIDLNVRTLTDLSLRWVEPMTRHRGGLMNVASVAGFVPGPRHAVYYASKAFVVSFTEALHHEWRRRGIRVTALCPGPVPTEFQARAETPDGVARSRLITSATRVAEEGYRGLMAGQRLVVPGFFNKVVVYGADFLPRRLLMALVEKRHRPSWQIGHLLMATLPGTSLAFEEQTGRT